jgi:hypothetical protein
MIFSLLFMLACLFFSYTVALAVQLNLSDCNQAKTRLAHSQLLPCVPDFRVALRAPTGWISTFT